MSFVVFLFSFIIATGIGGVSADSGQDEFNFQLIKHQPCSYSAATSKWDRLLEFEGGTDSSGPKLVQRPGEPNCFTIGGRVQVFKEFKGDFSIYLELRGSASKKVVPEGCAKRGDDGCGGIGSCLYCDACKALENKGLKAQLLVNGRPVKCDEGLKPGIYDNIQLAFCLPNSDELLKAQGLDKEAFKTLVQTEGGNGRSIGVFATIYVFNKDMRKLVQTQQKVEAVYVKTRRSIFKDEPLPAEIYWSLPFNSVIKEQRVFVACHKIYGNILIKPPKK